MGKRKKEGKRAGGGRVVWPKAPFFSQSAYKEYLESKRLGLFKRTYLMDSNLEKSSTTNTSAVS